MTKELGKITHVSFGHGGYQDCCIGLHVSLGGSGWGVNLSKSMWDSNLIKWNE